MRSEIEAARAREGRTSELAAEAREAREKLDGYEDDADGPQMSSPGRLRDLQQASEAADTRLERLQSSPPDAAPEGADAGSRPADEGTDEDTGGGGVLA
jgi:hypothetical protein